MLIKRPEPGANIRPHVVPKAKKSESIYLLHLCLQGKGKAVPLQA